MKMHALLGVAIVSIFAAASLAAQCEESLGPENGKITCPDGTGHFSMCIVQCNPGYVISGPSRQMCWCKGEDCTWKGAGSICKRANCDMPFYDAGRVLLADKWPRGFAGVVEFDKMSQTREIFYGWSIVIVFDKPLGKNASITSWNTKMSGASYDGQTFTLVNLEHNEDLSYILGNEPDMKVLFVVNYIDGDMPSAAYVGLYDTRVRDASCVLAPKMPHILPVGTKYEDSYFTVEQTLTTTTSTAATIATKAPKKSKRPRRPRKRLRKPPRPTPTTRKATTKLKTATQPQTRATKETKPITTRPTTQVVTTTTTLPANGRYCILQRDDDSYVSEKAWTDRGNHSFNANAKIDNPEYLEEWSMVIIFDAPVRHIEVWAAKTIDSSADGLIWTFGPLHWDSGLNPGVTKINFIATTKEVISGAASGKVFLCSDFFTTGDALMMRQQSVAPEPPEDEMEPIKSRTKRQASKNRAKGKKPRKGAAKTGRCAKTAKSGQTVSGAKQTPLNFAPNNDGTKYNYNELLHKSILFFEAQRSGKLPPDQRVPWRGDSGLQDGCDLNVDASGGWYDAGNHVKYNFPMAFSLTTLAWGAITFRDAYQDAGELQNVVNEIKWPTKYFIKCHTSKFELIGQVGDPEIDHSHWGRPEEMTMKRPTYKITANKPGTELAAETAAALAASSIFLKSADPKLSTDALKHARELYEFADTYRGSYHIAIPAAAEAYKSYSGFEDELVWAAAWLYKATNDNKYLKAAGNFYSKMNGQYAVEDRYAWDRKLVGAQALLAEMTGNDIYRNPLAKFLDNLETAETNCKGMYFLDEWGPNRYTSGSAFIALIAGTLVPHLPREHAYLSWAKKQMGMVLGDAGQSYVIGFGDNYPKKSQHRASSCPPFPQTCDWPVYESDENNRYVLYGALVGGPDENGVFHDDRDNVKENHVACDYNAVFQSAIAGLKHFAMKNRGKIVKPVVKPTPKPVTTTKRITTYATRTTPTEEVFTRLPPVTLAPTKPRTTKPPRPTISESERCARSSPTGVPVRNAKQTPLNFKPNNDGTKHNYNKALHLSILFFEAQTAGRLPAGHRVPWRGDSTLKDGCKSNADVSGGWFDAGDHVKFGFPMAFSLTTLAWGGIAFRNAYQDAGELQHMTNIVVNGAEFFINAHTAKYELIGQVGNGKADHDSWGRPETMSMNRPVYKITAKKPGTELAAEAAAGLAASSIFLKETHPKLSAEALRHAKELYEFADKYRGLYHKSITDAKEFYESVSGYDDELIWGAAWLYKATKDNKYLTMAAKNYNRIKGKYVVETRYSWDRKLCGAQALLGELTGKADYKNPFFKMIDGLMKAKTTPQGMFFLTKWGSNRYAAGAAFMAAIAASMNAPKKAAYQKWAQKQIDLMLGEAGQSYVVGYGSKYPKRPHHRSSSCPPYPQRCDWQTFNSPKPNYYILYGALVGGPDEKGKYLDKRNLYEQTEVTTDYNACFQSAVAGVKNFAMKSRGSVKPSPRPETKAPPTQKPVSKKPPVTKPKPEKKPGLGKGKKACKPPKSAKCQQQRKNQQRRACKPPSSPRCKQQRKNQQRKGCQPANSEKCKQQKRNQLQKACKQPNSQKCKQLRQAQQRRNQQQG